MDECVQNCMIRNWWQFVLYALGGALIGALLLGALCLLAAVVGGVAVPGGQPTLPALILSCLLAHPVLAVLGALIGGVLGLVVAFYEVREQCQDECRGQVELGSNVVDQGLANGTTCKDAEAALAAAESALAEAEQRRDELREEARRLRRSVRRARRTLEGATAAVAAAAISLNPWAVATAVAAVAAATARLTTQSVKLGRADAELAQAEADVYGLQGAVAVTQKTRDLLCPSAGKPISLPEIDTVDPISRDHPVGGANTADGQ